MTKEIVFAQVIEELVLRFFRRELSIESYGVTQFLMGAMVLAHRVQTFFYMEDPASASSLLETARTLVQQYEDLDLTYPDIKAYLDDTVEQFEAIYRPWNTAGGDWSHEKISQRTQSLPGMISPEIQRFYKWLGRRYTGFGAVVELGCWMGLSTACLVEGLQRNPRFRGHKMHVFDSFQWESWMDRYSVDAGLVTSAYRPGESFLGAFRQNCRPLLRHLEIHISQLHLDRRPRALPAMKWDGRPIEILVNDFSDDNWVTRRLWKLLSPSFVSGKTIIVLAQYGNCHANKLRQFVLDKRGKLIALYNPIGSAKSFLYI